MPDSQQTLDQMADEIFELYRLIALARSRQPAGGNELSEAEFLTLDFLVKGEPLTIGEIQKAIGVLPAQMSRIIRALEEEGGHGFLECRINPSDRRRVDVSLTQSGKDAYQRFRSVRLGSMQHILTTLAPNDRLDFMRMMRQLRTAYAEIIDPDNK